MLFCDILNIVQEKADSILLISALCHYNFYKKYPYAETFPDIKVLKSFFYYCAPIRHHPMLFPDKNSFYIPYKTIMPQTDTS